VLAYVVIKVDLEIMLVIKIRCEILHVPNRNGCPLTIISLDALDAVGIAAGCS